MQMQYLHQGGLELAKWHAETSQEFPISIITCPFPITRYFGIANQFCTCVRQKKGRRLSRFDPGLLVARAEVAFAL